MAPGTTKTVTVTIPALTVTSMSYFNMIITSGQDSTTIVPYQSIDVPRITTVMDGQTRTLTLPPWPLITNGPPNQWSFTTASTQTSTGVPVFTTESVPIVPLPDPPTESDNVPEITKTPYTGGPPATTTTKTPFVWPTGVHIEPVETPVPDEGEDNDGDDYTTSCKLWFFFVSCTKRE